MKINLFLNSALGFHLYFILSFCIVISVKGQVVLPNLPEVNGKISEIIPDGNGGVYISGNFSQVLSTPAVNRNDIAQIASDGTVTSWNPDSKYLSGASNSSISRMVKVGNTVYVVGAFDNIGGQNRDDVAGIDATTGLATSLNPSPNAGVYSIVSYGSNIYVGGSFDNIGGVSRSRLAAIDITNNQITDWNPSPNADIGSLFLEGTILYVGGGFTTIGGQNRLRVAALDINTGFATSWNPGMNNAFPVFTVNGDTVFVGGKYTSIGGQSRNGLAAVSATDGSVLPWNPNVSVSNWGATEMVISNGVLFVGGTQTTGPSQSISTLKSYDLSTGNLRAWDPNPNGFISYPTVSALMSMPNDVIYVGGDFTNIAGANRTSLAALSTIVRQNQTITFSPLPIKTVGDAQFNLTATSSSGLSISYTSSNTAVATINGSTVTIVGAGSTTITASQAGDINYNPATSIQQTLTVKQNQTITFNALSSKIYGAAPFNLSATASSGLAVSYTSSDPTIASISGNGVTILKAGTVNITASQAGNVTYNAAPDVVQSLIINKANQTITFAPLPNKAVGDAPFNLTGNASSGLTVSYASSNTAVATVSGSTVTIIGVGSTTITASQVGNSNYNPATSVQQALTVTTAKQNQTTTFNALASKTYGDLPFNLAATATSGLAVSYTSSDPTIASISGSTVTILKAGTVNITASQAGDATYNAASDVAQSLTINKASQTITFAALPNKAIGDAPFNLTGTSSSGLTINYTSSNTAVATVSGSTVTIIGVGSTTITAAQSGNSNYNPATSVQQTLTVTTAKLNQTITFNTLAAKAYGDLPFNLTATASSGLAVSYTSSDPTTATISGSSVTILKAGTVNITASQPGDATYNGASDVVRSLTINKANQTITFNALASKNVGDAPFNLTGTASSGLTVTYTSSNPEVVTVSGNTVTIVGYGLTSITAWQMGDINYNAASIVIQNLWVYKINQTIAFAPLPNKTVGNAPFTLSATASSGLPVSYTSSNTSVATVSGNIVTVAGAGVTTFMASQAGDNMYNAAASAFQSLTVNPAKLNQTITFNAFAAKTFGDAPFDLTGTSSSGLLITYTSSDPTIASVAGITVTILKAGTVNITASQFGNSVYNAATDVVQSLTINKANQNITFSPFQVSNTFNLEATASSGLPIIFTSSNLAVAVINGNVVTIVAPGTSTITASQSGNSSFNAAPDVTQPLVAIVTGLEPESVLFTMYPNPASEYLVIGTENTHTKNITIYQIDGRIVENVNTSDQEIKLAVANYSAGVYQVRIVSAQTVSVYRFVKK